MPEWGTLKNIRVFYPISRLTIYVLNEVKTFRNKKTNFQVLDFFSLFNFNHLNLLLLLIFFFSYSPSTFCSRQRSTFLLIKSSWKLQHSEITLMRNLQLLLMLYLLLKFDLNFVDFAGLDRRVVKVILSAFRICSKSNFSRIFSRA